MKNTLILVAIMWAISLSGAYAQAESTPPSTERMQAMKVAFITDKIKLIEGDIKTTIRRKDYLFSPL